MSKNNKFLTISIVLGAMFFNISSSAMENNKQEKKQENSNGTINIIKNQIGEKKEDVSSLKNEIREIGGKEEKTKKTEGVSKKFKEDEDLKLKENLFNKEESKNLLKSRYEEKLFIKNIKAILEKIKIENKKKLEKGFLDILEGRKCSENLDYIISLKIKIDENYFKKLIKLLHMALKEGTLNKNIDEIINLIKDFEESNDISLFIEKFKEYVDKKFMLIEKTECVSLNLKEISGDGIQKNIDVFLNELKSYVSSSSCEKLKYYLSNKEIEKEFINHVLQLIDRYKLTFFEELEYLTQNFNEIKEGEELRLFLIGLKDKNLTQEDTEKILEIAGKYIDKDSFNMFSYLLKPIEKNKTNINNIHIQNIIKLAENIKFKFLERVRKAIKEEYEEKIFIDEIKTTLIKLKADLNKNVSNLQRKRRENSNFEENLNYLIKTLAGKFIIERRNEQLEILFRILPVESLEKFIDEIINLAENNGKINFLLEFKNLIFEECKKPNEEVFIEEIQKTLIDLKNSLNKKMSSKKEERDEYFENLKKLTRKLCFNGINLEKVKEIILMLRGSSLYYEEDFINRCLNLLKRNDVNFLTTIGIMSDNEPKRREINKKIKEILKKLDTSTMNQLSEKEREEFKENAKIIFILDTQPYLADFKYVNISECVDAAFIHSNMRLTIKIKKNNNEGYFLNYKIEEIVNDSQDNIDFVDGETDAE